MSRPFLAFGLGPTWRALLRKRQTYFAVVLQIAIGFAIVGQSIGIAGGFIDTAEGPTGWDDRNVVLVTAERYEPNIDARGLRARDLAALRALPGVRDAEVAVNPPQSRRDLPDVLVTASGGQALLWSLAGGPRLAETLGAKLVAGRFPGDDDLAALAQGGPLPALLTTTLAEELFRGEDPAHLVGAVLDAPSRGRRVIIVGVIAPALAPAPFVALARQSLIYAVDPPAGRRAHFVVRVEPGQAPEVMARAAEAMRLTDPARWLEIRTLDEYRRRTVRNAYGAPRIIWTVNFIVVGVVLFGSLGMASFLVTERTRQIGIRRALGARRSDVVGYFLVENFLLTTCGLVAGVFFNVVLLEVLRRLGSEIAFSPGVLLAAAGVFWGVGLLAALVPALRASRIPPVVASKGADS